MAFSSGVALRKNLAKGVSTTEGGFLGVRFGM
jgi:hypothetical protein